MEWRKFDLNMTSMQKKFKYKELTKKMQTLVESENQSGAEISAAFEEFTALLSAEERAQKLSHPAEMVDQQDRSNFQNYSWNTANQKASWLNYAILAVLLVTIALLFLNLALSKLAKFYDFFLNKKFSNIKVQIDNSISETRQEEKLRQKGSKKSKRGVSPTARTSSIQLISDFFFPEISLSTALIKGRQNSNQQFLPKFVKINFLFLRALLILSLSIVATAIARSIVLGPLASCETNLEKLNTSYACLNKYNNQEESSQVDSLLSTEILISGLLTAIITSCLSFAFSLTHLRAVKSYFSLIKFKKPTFACEDLLVEDLAGEIILNSEPNSELNEKADVNAGNNIKVRSSGSKNAKEIFKQDATSSFRALLDGSAQNIQNYDSDIDSSYNQQSMSTQAHLLNSTASERGANSLVNNATSAANRKGTAAHNVPPVGNLLPIDEDLNDEKCSPIKPRKRTKNDSPFKRALDQMSLDDRESDEASDSNKSGEEGQRGGFGVQLDKDDPLNLKLDNSGVHSKGNLSDRPSPARNTELIGIDDPINLPPSQGGDKSQKQESSGFSLKMERIEGESMESAKQQHQHQHQHPHKASQHNIFTSQTVSDYALNIDSCAAGAGQYNKVGTAQSGSRNQTTCQENGISLALNSDSTVANENATMTIPARMQLPQSTKHVNNKRIRKFSAQPQTGRNTSDTIGLAYGGTGAGGDGSKGTQSINYELDTVGMGQSYRKGDIMSSGPGTPIPTGQQIVIPPQVHQTPYFSEQVQQQRERANQVEVQGQHQVLRDLFVYASFLVLATITSAALYLSLNMPQKGIVFSLMTCGVSLVIFLGIQALVIGAIWFAELVYGVELVRQKLNLTKFSKIKKENVKAALDLLFKIDDQPRDDNEQIDQDALLHDSIQKIDIEIGKGMAASSNTIEQNQIVRPKFKLIHRKVTETVTFGSISAKIEREIQIVHRQQQVTHLQPTQIEQQQPPSRKTNIVTPRVSDTPGSDSHCYRVVIEQELNNLDEPVENNASSKRKRKLQSAADFEGNSAHRLSGKVSSTKKRLRKRTNTKSKSHIAKDLQQELAQIPSIEQLSRTKKQEIGSNLDDKTDEKKEMEGSGGALLSGVKKSLRLFISSHKKKNVKQSEDAGSFETPREEPRNQIQSVQPAKAKFQVESASQVKETRNAEQDRKVATNAKKSILLRSNSNSVANMSSSNQRLRKINSIKKYIDEKASNNDGEQSKNLLIVNESSKSVIGLESLQQDAKNSSQLQRSSVMLVKKKSVGPYEDSAPQESNPNTNAAAMGGGMTDGNSNMGKSQESIAKETKYSPMFNSIQRKNGKNSQAIKFQNQLQQVNSFDGQFRSPAPEDQISSKPQTANNMPLDLKHIITNNAELQSGRETHMQSEEQISRKISQHKDILSKQHSFNSPGSIQRKMGLTNEKVNASIDSSNYSRGGGRKIIMQDEAQVDQNALNFGANNPSLSDLKLKIGTQNFDSIDSANLANENRRKVVNQDMEGIRDSLVNMCITNPRDPKAKLEEQRQANEYDEFAAGSFDLEGSKREELNISEINSSVVAGKGQLLDMSSGASKAFKVKKQVKKGRVQVLKADSEIDRSSQCASRIVDAKQASAMSGSVIDSFGGDITRKMLYKHSKPGTEMKNDDYHVSSPACRDKIVRKSTKTAFEKLVMSSKKMVAEKSSTKKAKQEREFSQNSGDNVFVKPLNLNQVLLKGDPSPRFAQNPLLPANSRNSPLGYKKSSSVEKQTVETVQALKQLASFSKDDSGSENIQEVKQLSPLKEDLFENNYSKENSSIVDLAPSKTNSRVQSQVNSRVNSRIEIQTIKEDSFLQQNISNELIDTKKSIESKSILPITNQNSFIENQVQEDADEDEKSYKQEESAQKKELTTTAKKALTSRNRSSVILPETGLRDKTISNPLTAQGKESRLASKRVSEGQVLTNFQQVNQNSLSHVSSQHKHHHHEKCLQEYRKKHNATHSSREGGNGATIHESSMSLDFDSYDHQREEDIQLYAKLVGAAHLTHRLQDQRRRLESFLCLAQQAKSRKDICKIREMIKQLDETRRPLPLSKINELKQLELMTSPYNQSLIAMIQVEIDQNRQLRELRAKQQLRGGQYKLPKNTSQQSQLVLKNRERTRTEESRITLESKYAVQSQKSRKSNRSRAKSITRMLLGSAALQKQKFQITAGLQSNNSPRYSDQKQQSPLASAQSKKSKKMLQKNEINTNSRFGFGNVGQNIVIENHNLRVSADRLKLEKGGKHVRSGLALHQLSSEMNNKNHHEKLSSEEAGQQQMMGGLRENAKSGLNIVNKCNGTLDVSDKDISSRNGGGGGSICSRRRTCSIPSSKDSKKKRRRQRNRRNRSQKENQNVELRDVDRDAEFSKGEDEEFVSEEEESDNASEIGVEDQANQDYN